LKNADFRNGLVVEYRASGCRSEKADYWRDLIGGALQEPQGESPVFIIRQITGVIWLGEPYKNRRAKALYLFNPQAFQK